MNRSRFSSPHCAGPISRRGFLEVGGMSLFGLGLGGLLEALVANALSAGKSGGTFGKAKSCIIRFICGPCMVT